VNHHGRDGSSKPATEVLIMSVEKSTITLTLTGVPGDRKVSVIKVVRQLTGLGLMEAKDAVEALPATIRFPATDDSLASMQELESTGAVFTSEQVANPQLSEAAERVLRDLQMRAMEIASVLRLIDQDSDSCATTMVHREAAWLAAAPISGLAAALPSPEARARFGIVATTFAPGAWPSQSCVYDSRRGPPLRLM
jgi:hypothetical protein